MKRKWVLLKILMFLVFLGFLLIFSQKQFEKREIKNIIAKIDYADGNYFITEKVVKEILGETHRDFPKMAMKSVEINRMEENLKKNPFIKNAEVFWKQRLFAYQYSARKTDCAGQYRERAVLHHARRKKNSTITALFDSSYAGRWASGFCRLCSHKRISSKNK